MQFLVAIAHPDDETLLNGTLAKLAAEGHGVTVLCATRGEVGEIADAALATPETLGAVREGELREAMATLGVDDVRFFHYRDSGMAGTPENDDPRALVQAEPMEVIMDLVALMQEVYPDVVITWDASGGYGHPDHIRVHETVTEAFASYKMRSGNAVRLYYWVFPADLMADVGAEMRALGFEWGIDEEGAPSAVAERLPVTTIIDVEAQMELARQAMAAHRTQLTPMFESFDRLSEPLRRRFIGLDYYHRVDPPWSEGEPVETSFEG